MGSRLSDRKQLAIMAEYERTGSIRRAAKFACVTFRAARRVILDSKSYPRVNVLRHPAEDMADAFKAAVTREEGENSGSVEFKTRTPIRTMDDAIRHAEIDLTVWNVVRCTITAGETAMKLRTFADGKVTGETPRTEPVWWVKLTLERVLRKAERDALEGLFKRLESRTPVIERFVVQIARPSHPHLMVLDLVDLHFGKLAWAPETGQNYDLRIAERVYRDAVTDLLSRSKGFPVEEFLVPLGSDFLHVDNSGGTTTAGTPQDVDGRLAKILEVAEASVVWAVEELASRGRVHLAHVPGNHDRLLSYCLARTIAAYFRSCPNVTVDVSPSPRKYHRYHATLIGLTHGDEEKHSILPVVMATERPKDWAETTCREWHLGHWHKSKRLDFLPLDTHGGVPVRILRSLSATDAWHFRKAFVGCQRSAEGYIYSRHGYVGHVVADVRKEDA